MMRMIVNTRPMLIGLALAATAAMSACSANGGLSTAGPGTGHTTAPAATASASAPAAAGTPSDTPSAQDGIQNLVLTGAEKSNLTAAYVALKGISISDVAGAAPSPGTAYYAYDPATTTYWALANFLPSSTASLQVQVGFQDGGEIGMFNRVGSGSWQAHLGVFPPLCGELTFFPHAVLAAWGKPTSLPAGLNC